MDKEFVDLCFDYYNPFNTEKKANSYVKKLKSLRWNVVIEKATKPTILL